jgi:hypothetical protein
MTHSDWADEIAKEIDMDWPSVTAALRKARQDALEDVESELCKRTIYRRHHLIAAIRALKDKP